MTRFIWLLLVLLITSCSFSLKRAVYHDSSSMIEATRESKPKPSLKLHLKNGDVCIFRKVWNIDSSYYNIIDTGIQFDYNRNLNHYGALVIPIDSISLFETNTKGDSPNIIPLLSIPVILFIDVLTLIYFIPLGIE